MTTAGTGVAVDSLTHVHVVVPANNEEALLPRTLRTLHDAVDELRRARPTITTHVTLVLDSCTDGSRDVARLHPEVRAVEVDYRCVGAARAHGVAAATAGVPDSERGRHWLANTDADCAVPTDWLVRQAILADAGVDLVTGTVEPDGDDLDPAVLARWQALHQLRDGHPHVHGANLGLRLSTYVSSGGFRAVPLHEDVGLVEQARVSGDTCLASSALHVRTSGRTRGRAPGGFAHFLSELETGASLAG